LELWRLFLSSFTLIVSCEHGIPVVRFTRGKSHGSCFVSRVVSRVVSILFPASPGRGSFGRTWFISCSTEVTHTQARQEAQDGRPGGGIEGSQNSELEEKHQLVRRMNDLVQELGGSEFIINPLTAPYCSASDLRTAVEAWEALATSERAKSST